jgi:hypothetical protein
MANFDDAKLCVEALTGGKNTIILDDREMPSIMVRWEKQKNNAILTGGSDVVHPGSIVNGVEKTMYVSKYQNIVMNDRAYSLPFQDPRVNVNFDQAVSFCRNKKTTGGAWGLMPFSLWAQIALWCKKNGTMPRGNNNYGADHGYPHEKGVPTAYESATAQSHAGEPLRCATGSGPATWNHNWLPDGIADLNGNVWEWCAGLRLNAGEIQIIPNANCMDSDIPLTAASTYWKAIAADGSLVDPGTAGTLKYDSTFKIVQTLTAETGTPSGSFTSLGKADGLTIPEIAKALILYPADPSGDYGGDYHWWNVEGERLPICGGSWDAAAGAGVFGVHLDAPRSGSGGGVGFRSAFCEL